MAYYAISPRAFEGDPTPENRVWGFFADPNKSRLPNRLQSPQPRRKNRATTTRTVSGIPLWPSRDPIEERGGANLHHFVYNDGLNLVDPTGLEAIDGKTKNCTTDSFSFRYILANTPGIPLSPFVTLRVQGSIDISISAKTCDICCEGEWKKNGYGELAVGNANIGITAQLTGGIDRTFFDSSNAGLRIRAGIMGDFRVSGGANGRIFEGCNGPEGEITGQVSISGDLSIGASLTGRIGRRRFTLNGGKVGVNATGIRSYKLIGCSAETGSCEGLEWSDEWDISGTIYGEGSFLGRTHRQDFFTF